MSRRTDKRGTLKGSRTPRDGATAAKPPAPRRDDSREVSRALLAFYDRQRRDLPWRRQPSPYRTLVSELMLQQTVVATVIPYFERFVARFPDFAALAAASEAEVLALWSGLGYYARGRNLHRVAQVVVREHGGELPRDEDALRALPGIGPYTAAAIAAIAFDVPTLALDGNVARVLARMFAEREAIDRPAVRESLRERGRALVPRERAGDFAQALMELGALVCVPTSTPRCLVCPVAARCQARAAGIAGELPVRLPKRPKQVVRLACVAVVRRGRVLLVQRPPRTLLAGTWALPAAEVPARADPAAHATRGLQELGLPADGAIEELGSIRHVFTHRDVTAHVFRVKLSKARAELEAGRWVPFDGVAGLAISSFTKKTLSLL